MFSKKMDDEMSGSKLIKLKSFFQKVTKHPFFTRGLIFASILYTGILVFVSIDEIKRIDWTGLLPVFVICFIVIGVSILLQALSWAFIMKKDEFPLRYNLLVYFKTLLMKRLPGGIWHWIGRNHLYIEGEEGKKQGIRGSVIEWLGLLFSGLSLLAFTYGFLYGLLTITLLLAIFHFLFVKWFTDNNSSKLSIFVYLVYLVCWIFGSLLIFLLITDGFQVTHYTFLQAVNTWTSLGTISTLFFFLPSGIIVKEFSLIYLLDGVLSFNAIVLLSLQLRILMLVTEIIVGFFGYILLSCKLKQPS